MREAGSAALVMPEVRLGVQCQSQTTLVISSPDAVNVASVVATCADIHNQSPQGKIDVSPCHRGSIVDSRGRDGSFGNPPH